jgi:hypothetical protein
MIAACGIWLSKYKSQRPEERWECNLPPGRKRRGRLYQKKASYQNTLPSEANYPQSEANFPQSEAFYPQSEAAGPMDGPSPASVDSTSEITGAESQKPTGQSRANSVRPIKRLHAMTSDAASAALRRAIRSSPARWGTQNSPIDLEEDELGATRRILFPSPRKDASPKVLGEVATTNIVQITTDFHPSKGQAVETADKENLPPGIDEENADPELLRLLEEAMARPSTPVGKSPAPNPFKTPTQPTPHRPVTRSVSRSIRSAKSPAQLLLFRQDSPSRTPGTARRRGTPRHNAPFESPFTATLNQLMSESHNHLSPSRNRDDFQLDFSLPDLPAFDNNGSNMNFQIPYDNEDFFSTDVPMPSSPPRAFHMYEDPISMGNINWNNGLENCQSLQNVEQVEIKKEPGFEGESPDEPKDDEEPGSTGVEEEQTS